MLVVVRSPVDFNSSNIFVVNSWVLIFIPFSSLRIFTCGGIPDEVNVAIVWSHLIMLRSEARTPRVVNSGAVNSL